MGWLKNFIDALLFSVLFYIVLGIMIVFQGHSVPSWAFSGIGVLTILIYLFSQVTNYRLG